jgi:hypothetical protein
MTDVYQSFCLINLRASPGLKKSFLPPKVAVPKLSTGTLIPDAPKNLYSIILFKLLVTNLI